MFYNYNSILIIGTEKTGGLFDFDGTLPVIAIQFVLFMFILNFIPLSRQTIYQFQDCPSLNKDIS